MSHNTANAEESASSGAVVPADHVVLSVGHSARRLYHTLHHDCGVLLTAKPIAVGFRIEHPQELINRIQYGNVTSLQCERGEGKVPVADYKVAAEVFVPGESDDAEGEYRNCYSFCMCPGGQIGNRQFKVVSCPSLFLKY